LDVIVPMVNNFLDAQSQKNNGEPWPISCEAGEALERITNRKHGTTCRSLSIIREANVPH
jgi:hypothetical protein